ncbi:MAG: ACP phosphodiesterase [Granulosicoccus sp.]
MNFLAHSLLGFDDSSLVAGQFCGDFVRGRDLSRFPAGIERGIRLHRYLDRYADTYEPLLRSRQAMTDLPRRFSGIVVDVLFDHFLANHWEQVSDVSLSEHAQNVHSSLRFHEPILPDSLKRFMDALEEHDILINNRFLPSIEYTLLRLSKRSPKFSPLAMNQMQLKVLTESLHDSFVGFYPKLNQAAVDYLANNPLTGEQSGE